MSRVASCSWLECNYALTVTYEGLEICNELKMQTIIVWNIVMSVGSRLNEKLIQPCGR